MTQAEEQLLCIEGETLFGEQDMLDSMGGGGGGGGGGGRRAGGQGRNGTVLFCNSLQLGMKGSTKAPYSNCSRFCFCVQASCNGRVLPRYWKCGSECKLAPPPQYPLIFFFANVVCRAPIAIFRNVRSEPPPLGPFPVGFLHARDSTCHNRRRRQRQRRRQRRRQQTLPSSLPRSQPFRSHSPAFTTVVALS